MVVAVDRTDYTERPRCKNCESPLTVLPDGKLGSFCPACGQDTHNHPPSFFEFVHEFITHYVALEGRLWKTLFLLFFKPAELTREYRAGRKLRYISPLRLYITASFLFFFIVKIVGVGSFMQDDIDEAIAPRQKRSEAITEPISELAPAAKDVKAEFGTVLESTSDADKRAIPTQENAAQAESVKEKSTTEAAPQAKTQQPKSSQPQAPHEKGRTDQDDDSGWRNRKWTWTDENDQKASVNFQCKPGSTGCNLLKKRLQEKFKGRTNGQVLEDLKHSMVANVPYVLFLMLPLFAALTKLLYVTRGLYYGEHVVYALHVHAFTFFGLLIAALVPDFLTGWIIGLIAVYYLVAMKRFFAAGWFTTLLRYGVIASVYPILLTFVAMFVMMGVLVF